MHNLSFCAPSSLRPTLNLPFYSPHSVDTIYEEPIPGKRGFYRSLNEGRLQKRPTEFTADKVLQDFDPARFNFTKVNRVGPLIDTRSLLTTSIYILYLAAGIGLTN